MGKESSASGCPSLVDTNAEATSDSLNSPMSPGLSFLKRRIVKAHRPEAVVASEPEPQRPPLEEEQEEPEDSKYQQTTERQQHRREEKYKARRENNYQTKTPHSTTTNPIFFVFDLYSSSHKRHIRNSTPEPNSKKFKPDETRPSESNRWWQWTPHGLVLVAAVVLVVVWPWKRK